MYIVSLDLRFEYILLDSFALILSLRNQDFNEKLRRICYMNVEITL